MSAAWMSTARTNIARTNTAKVSAARMVAVIGVVVALGGATACSTEEADVAVSVTGTDDACEISESALSAGRISFEFTNEADDVSELYVLRDNDDIVSEVENVTTGTTRTLTVDLAEGEYRVRCRPGQTGEGFRTEFQVTGKGGEAAQTADRAISFESVDFTYPDLDVSDITAGGTIRFEMTNRGEQAHEFEVIDPSGEPIGEVASMDPGASGGATISFDDAGEYVYQCILVDPATEKPHTELGMKGTFEVPPA